MRRHGGSGAGRLWIGVLVAVIAVAGIGYLLLGELQGGGQGATKAVTSTQSSPRTSQADAAPATPTQDTQRPADRGDTILTCTAADGQVYYTNATRCEDADLGNRVNVFETPSLPASKPEGCLGAQPGGARTQLFLPICHEPFNQALELEPFLLESPDPQSTRAARRYCAFITEGVQAGCMATSDQFCFLYLCQALRDQEGP